LVGQCHVTRFDKSNCFI